MFQRAVSADRMTLAPLQLRVCCVPAWPAGEQEGGKAGRVLGRRAQCNHLLGSIHQQFLDMQSSFVVGGQPTTPAFCTPVTPSRVET